MLIPFADSLNHEEVSISYLEFDPKLGTLQDEVDCSDFFRSPEEPQPTTPEVPEASGTHRNRLEKYLASGGRVESVQSFTDLDVLLQGLESSSDGDSAASFPDSDSDSGSESDDIPQSTSIQASHNPSEPPPFPEESKSPVTNAQDPDTPPIQPPSTPDTVEPLNPANFFALATRNTSFINGKEVFNCYGRLNNSDLLTFYGFLLPECYRDSVTFYVFNPVLDGKWGFVPVSTLQEMTKSGKFPYKKALIAVKLKKRQPNEGLITYCRRPHVFRYKLDHPEAESLFSCSPTLAVIEEKAVSDALALLELLKNDRFAGNFDLSGENQRENVAKTYRNQQLSVVTGQISVLSTLLSVLRGEIANFSLELLTFSSAPSSDLLSRLYPLKKYLRSMKANKQMWLPTTLPARPTPGYVFS